MKWLGKVEDPKDLTTKEYVDNADEALQESIESRLEEIDSQKIDSTELVGFTANELQELWTKYIN